MTNDYAALVAMLDQAAADLQATFDVFGSAQPQGDA